MHIGYLLIIALTSSVTISIRIPEEADYHCLNFPLRIIVETDEMYIDSVRYSINNETPVVIEKSNTDWYTYMCNDSHSGYSESIAPDDDRLLWTAPVTGVLHEFPTPVVVDGVVFYPSDYGSDSLYALDALTGEVIWESTVDFMCLSCMTSWNGLLFVPTWGSSKITIRFRPLYALDCETGDTVWINISSPYGYWDSSPVIDNGRLYIAGFQGIIHAINANSGNTIWIRQVTEGECLPCLHRADITATPALHQGKLFFADQYDYFYCLDAETGKTLWRVPGSQHGSPALAEGVVFFGEHYRQEGSRVIALNAESGDEIWSYETGNTQIFSSPAISNGIMYIAGTDNNLYAFGSGYKFLFSDSVSLEEGTNTITIEVIHDDRIVSVYSDSIMTTYQTSGYGSYGMTDQISSNNRIELTALYNQDKQPI